MFYDGYEIKSGQLETDSTSNCDGRATREDVLAAVEQVADHLEDHFGWSEPSKVPANQPRLGPAPHFSFEVHGDEPDHWRYVMSCIRQEMSREEAALREIRQSETSSGKKRSRFASWLSRQWKKRSGAPSTPVSTWSVDDVCTWLNSLGLSQYSSQFKQNDVRGRELRLLERSDFKDLGVFKIGHVKRVQTAIAELVAKEEDGKRTGRKGTSLSSERPAPELPSMSSV
ncbi:unnamed protein product [Auanema sp. JU1783]|nr:unnamed protein product [Auanema sp. JU1783]